MKFNRSRRIAYIMSGMFAFSGYCLQSCKEVFEKSLDKMNVVLTAPGNNVAADSGQQSFYWQPIDTIINYELQIASPRFDSIVSLILDTTLQRNTLSVLLSPAKYEWRVRAYNSSSTTVFSSPWTITIN